MERSHGPAAALEGLAGRRIFRFVAKADGRRRTGIIRADNRETALAELSQRRWIPVLLEEVRARDLQPRGVSSGRPREAAALFGQLALLYRSGVPLNKGLDVLKQQAPPQLWESLARVHSDLQTGHRLSDALRKRSEIFPTWCASAVAAAERSGDLAATLDRLAATLERSEALRRRVLRALSYPLSVLLLAFVLNAALFRAMLPAFEKSFAQAEVAISGFSRVVMDLAWAAGDPWLWSGLGLAAAGGWLALKRPVVRGACEALLDRLPVFGPLRQRAADARFLYNLAALLESGMPLQGALALVRDGAASTALATRLEAVRRDVVGRGRLLSEAFADHGFGSLARHLTGAAEESGDYPTMLRRIAETLSEDLELSLDSLASVLEPALVGLVGAMIAVVIVALFLPLYATASTW